jgi:hypothetical protein
MKVQKTEAKLFNLSFPTVLHRSNQHHETFLMKIDETLIKGK